MLQFTGRVVEKDNERYFEMSDGSLHKPSPREDTELVVVWHGAMPDPNGFGKGILLDPRLQTEDERLKAMPRLDDGGPDSLTIAELEAAIARLNASLKNPLDLSKPPACWRRGVERPL
jgi:hypothetical protein